MDTRPHYNQTGKLTKAGRYLHKNPESSMVIEVAAPTLETFVPCVLTASGMRWEGVAHRALIRKYYVLEVKR